jgi:hypothetical protein
MTHEPPSLPLIVAGMHRSGTSMTASFMQALGVDVGSNLIAADGNNRKGYFEDWDFVALHHAMFEAACPPGEPGWPDVGWTESERLDAAAIDTFRGDAERLVAQRLSLPLWGWKDPRTTLLLPFWDALLPTARYVLVYRNPWDVVDSLLRAGHAVLHEHPEFALRIWLLYNRRLLAFFKAHPDRCVLVSTNRVRGRLGDFSRLLQDKLGLPVTCRDPEQALEALLDDHLMKDLPPDSPLIALYRAHYPEAIALLQDLDAVADLPGPPAPPPLPLGPAVAAVHAQVRAEETALRAEAARWREVAERARAQAGAREADMQAVLGSTSWRLTAPLRRLVSLTRPSAPNRPSEP